MLKNKTTKEKLFINMVISQMGLALLIITSYLSSKDITLVVGLVFMAIIGYISYVSMKQITQGITTYRKYFNDFLDYISMKQNKIKKVTNLAEDEIGQMLQEVNEAIDIFEKKLQDDMKLIGEIVLTTDKVEQGIYKCRVNTKSTNPMLQTLSVNINKMLNQLEKTVKELADVVDSYANDDFTKKIDISKEIKAELLITLQSVNKLGDSLSNSAKLNLSNGQNLESNSATMNQSVNNLADKANQQAASLEETAAAVEEITSTTRNNANNAVKMSELGNQVKNEVSKGMNLASQTSSSMDEINEQVTAITEAITVIDQIAFQTNILSLNAAVEAATAGEAGKGFAVVAQEVRNLAARSADAANEIKTIVETAREKADEGKKVSDDMIQGYETLNENFNQTIALIEDVSNASKEQMTGIEQINDTVTMLDRVTQENASEANSVAQIAQDVSKMANDLVNDASHKKFI